MQNINKLLTIVVPTYNMEELLPRCLASVTDERIPSSLEVIVVNDGSTDKSLVIAQEFQKKRTDIVRIIDKRNGHYGSCINAALPITRGKYFRILDADDEFCTDALVGLLERIKHIDVDLIITLRTEHITYANGSEEIIRYPINNIEYNKIYNMQGFDIHQHIHGDEFNMHSMTYKTQLLRDVGHKHIEGICYTDFQYCFLPIDKAKDFIVFDLYLYQYYIGRSESSTNCKALARNLICIIKVISSLIEHYNQTPSHNVITKNNQLHFIQLSTTILFASIEYQTTLSKETY